jgi:hypothetical protein
MISYELIACRNGRWVSDGILATRKDALEEARTLVERDALVTAVRVVMLENQKDELVERPVCSVLASAARKPSTPTTQSTIKLQKPANDAGGHRDNGVVRNRRSWSPREIMLATAAVAAATALLWYGAMLPKQQWAFDLPAAQQPHMLRDTFTGTYSEPQQ